MTSSNIPSLRILSIHSLARAPGEQFPAIEDPEASPLEKKEGLLVRAMAEYVFREKEYNKYESFLRIFSKFYEDPSYLDEKGNIINPEIFSILTFEELKQDPALFYEVVNTIKICNQNLFKNNDINAPLLNFFIKHGYHEESLATSSSERQQELIERQQKLIEKNQRLIEEYQKLSGRLARKRKRFEVNEDLLNKNFLLAAKNGNIQTLRSLSQVVNIDEIKKASPLHLAALNGQVEVIEFLVNELNFNVHDKGCLNDVFKVGIHWPPLMWAVYNDHGPAVKKLIDLGANVNFQWEVEADLDYDDSKSPWIYSNEAKLFAEHLCSNSFPFEEDKFSPLLIAVQLGNSNTALALLNSGVTLTKDAFIIAVKYCSKEVVEAFFQKGADESFANYTFIRRNFFKRKREFSPLHVACKRGDAEIVKLLIQKGAEPNGLIKNSRECLNDKGYVYYTWSPLMQAAHGDASDEILDILINSGATIDAKNNEGLTALNWVVANRFENINAIRYLIRNTADVNTVDNLKEAPLLKLINNLTNFDKRYLPDMLIAAHILIQNGADINVEDKDGKTILMTLIEYYIEIILNDQSNPKILNEIQPFIQFLIQSNAIVTNKDHQSQTVFDKLNKVIQYIERECTIEKLPEHDQRMKSLDELKKMFNDLQSSYQEQ
ncbi:MAG: hypothetical protein K940chlam5_00574, partial [Candidatus Anoxychlamydiales bacterium]|nr:hypothetical protein [Candidatus Anoxychlamydiales bacterium]